MELNYKSTFEKNVGAPFLDLFLGFLRRDLPQNESAARRHERRQRAAATVLEKIKEFFQIPRRAKVRPRIPPSPSFLGRSAAAASPRRRRAAGRAARDRRGMF